MLEKYNTYKVLKVFLDSPTYEYGLREISRKINLSAPSVKIILSRLINDEFVRLENRKGLPVYLANRDNPQFIFYKKLFFQHVLVSSGLVDFLWEKFAPQAIILYGSFAKGESVESSDVDIFIIGKEVRVDLAQFEKKIGKTIHLMVNKTKNIPKELKNNLINGVVLKGYWKVIE